MSDNNKPNIALIAAAAAAVGMIAARVISKALQDVEQRAQKAEQQINRRIDSMEKIVKGAYRFLIVMAVIQVATFALSIYNG